jgi:hypothetical protein
VGRWWAGLGQELRTWREKDIEAERQDTAAAARGKLERSLSEVESRAAEP